jgi:hypothetical protein
MEVREKSQMKSMKSLDEREEMTSYEEGSNIFGLDKKRKRWWDKKGR